MSMNGSIFKTSRFHLALLLVAALTFVVASLSIPQKAYDYSGLSISCGKPFNYLSVHLDRHHPAFPHAMSCMDWDPMDEKGSANILLLFASILSVFMLLFGVAVVLPRLLAGPLSFLKFGNGDYMHTALIVASVTALIVGSFYTVKLNDIKIATDNADFSVDEAVHLVWVEHPSLFDHGSVDNVDRSVEHAATVNGWNLQFIESKSEAINWGECYAVEYRKHGFDGPGRQQVTLTGSFRGAEAPVYDLDDKCQPLR